MANKLSVAGLYCSVIGHQFKVEKNITNHIKEYKCCRCGLEVTNNAKGNIVPLTEKLRDTHASLQMVITKRRNKGNLRPGLV